MNHVITINLNGIAYQLEEAGYAALRTYLDRAGASLKDNPDKEEILMDLERAIAEKCDKVLNANKNVVTEKEMLQIIEEMGPVHGSEETEQQQEKAAPGGAPKRLYQIREGALISGVCNGIAAYFDIDVTLVRVAFVILTILTHGAFIAVYFIMTMIVPYATTGEERAAAHGMPFNAQELVERTRASYAKYANMSKQEWRKWHREMRMQSKHHARQWQNQWQQQWAQNAPYAGQVWGRAMHPLMALCTVALTIGWLYVLITFLQTGLILGYAVTGIPVWLTIVILVCAYNIVLMPLRAGRYIAFSNATGAPGWVVNQGGWFGMWDGLMWLGFFIIAGWAAFTYIPSIHDFVLQLPVFHQ